MMKNGLNSKTGNVVKDKRPCFFKVLHPQLLTDHLRIPPEFRKHIHEGLSREGRLRVPSRGIWSVKVVKVANEILLKDGWSDFVRDNSLGNNEFLVFTFEGNLNFKVEIFDANGVKRIRMSDLRSSQQLPVERPGNDRDPRLQHCKNAAKSFTSEFPFFERCMSSYNVQNPFTLNLPQPFCRKYLSAEKSKIILRNEKGKSWKAKYTPYTTGCFVRGDWKGFVQDNKINENDICMFELVGAMEFNVHIYRSSGSHP